MNNYEKKMFKSLTTEEQKNFLIDKVYSIVKNDADKYNLNHNASLSSKLGNLKEKDCFYNYKNIALELIEYMKLMQDHPILVTEEEPRKISAPVFKFNFDDILISISYYKGIDSLYLLETIVSFIENRFMQNKEARYRLNLKR